MFRAAALVDDDGVPYPSMGVEAETSDVLVVAIAASMIFDAEVL